MIALDFDGVLVDTWPMWRRACEEATGVFLESEQPCTGKS